MKNLVIVGAGGCGREVLQWAKAVNKVEGRWNIKGFLDDNKDALYGRRSDIPVLAKVDDYVIEPGDEFVCCIGDSNIRKMIVEKLKKKAADRDGNRKRTGIWSQWSLKRESLPTASASF